MTVVISPLISLMRDQCLKLSKWGVSACFLGSGQPDNSIEKKAMCGLYDLIYVCPETVLRCWLHLCHNLFDHRVSDDHIVLILILLYIGLLVPFKGLQKIVELVSLLLMKLIAFQNGGMISGQIIGPMFQQSFVIYYHVAFVKVIILGASIYNMHKDA